MRSIVPTDFRLPVLLVLLSLQTILAAEEKPTRGESIYRERCITCHGKNGEGVETLYPEPLIGDLSVKELTAYIDKTMPEGEAEQCIGEDASAVAAFIHRAFYSPTAQARIRPARIDLQRLTVGQYRNSVADLAAGFVGRRNFGEQRGLRAEYFNSRRRRRENRKIERVDAAVDFDFGQAGPFEPEPLRAEKPNPPQDKDEQKEEQKDEGEYSIVWTGSLFAPESGLYEIILETDNAGQLWLNDNERPFIDAKVKSGDQTEYRASVMLLAGRLYNLRLEFNKSKTEKTGAVKLRWQRPGHIDEVIASRYFSPNSAPWVLVVETPFPPDDKSVGYERGVSVSREWNAATTYAAIDVTEKIIEHLRQMADLPREREQHSEKLREFCYQFTERAFRRPLSDAERQLYVNRQFEEAADDRTAVKRVILLTLKSPRFLFPGSAATQFDDYRVAEWLALTLWDSIPDDKLWEAAAAGKLSNRAEVESQARRMVQDDRAQTKLKGFFHQWLNLGHFHDLTKSSEQYPGFDEAIASDLRTSLDLFLDEIIAGDTSGYRQLLTSEDLYLNNRLAEFYGVDLPRPDGFQKVALPGQGRSGVLTHPFLLSGLAYDDSSSPIHRGVFLSRSLLGRFLKPPPIAVAPVPVSLHPDMTTRERVAMQTSGTTCMACHGMINQLGFSLENYDAVGRYRTEERGQVVDAGGRYIDRQGTETPFRGARELAHFLIESEEAHGAFVEQMFQYLTKQPIQAFGSRTYQKLRTEFPQNGFPVRRLMGDIAVESIESARALQSK